MTAVKRFPCPLPYEGLDVSAPVHSLSSTRSDRVVNMLVHEDYRMRQRGPVLWKVTTTPRNATDAGDLTGGFYGHPIPTAVDRIGMAAYTSPFTGSTAWRWQVYDALGPAAIVDPTFGRGAYYVPSTGALTTAAAADTGNSGQWSPNWTIFEGNPISVSLVRNTLGASALYQTYQGKQIPRYEMWVWFGPGIGWGQAGGDTEAGDSAPRGLQAVCSYARRLWVGGGATPGASNAQYAAGAAAHTVRPNTLWYTEVDSTPSTANFGGVYLNNWKAGGVASGIINSIVVGNEDPSDYILQLVATDRYMLILKRNSVWVLTGAGLDTFAVRKLADYGIVDPRGSQVLGTDVYWISPRGLMRYDGAEVTVVSGPVAPEWQSADLNGLTETVLARLADDYLLVGLSTLISNTILKSTGRLGHYRSYLYHVPTGRWSYFNAPALGSDGPGSGSVKHAAFVNGVAYFVDEQQVYQSGITRPDTQIGSGLVKSVDLGQASVLYGFDSGLRYAPVRLAATAEKSQLHRVGVNYRWLSDDAAATGNRWWASIYPYTYGQDFTTAGTPQLQGEHVGAFVLDLRSNVTAQDKRPQVSFGNFYEETPDAFIEVWQPGALATGTSLDEKAEAELLDAWLEVRVSPTHQIKT